jgi:hypothetical protein
MGITGHGVCSEVTRQPSNAERQIFKPTTQTGFGALTYATSPPTGLLGVGLGGDSTPRMIAFQLRWSSEIVIVR